MCIDVYVHTYAYTTPMSTMLSPQTVYVQPVRGCENSAPLRQNIQMTENNPS